MATSKTADFVLSSAAVPDGGTFADEQLLNGFGCTGGNISPDLSWSGAPAATKSFALTMFDPDAPTGSGFWHWLIVNIPPSVTKLPKGAGNPGSPGLPAGALQTRTDLGVPGYGGPCPPAGDKPHRYQFTLFAVDVDKLDVTADSSGAAVGFALHFHGFARTGFTATFGR
jgi:Raf kinase inhibitor-like YbhB/YbcL family protein